MGHRGHDLLTALSRRRQTRAVRAADRTPRAGRPPSAGGAAGVGSSHIQVANNTDGVFHFPRLSGRRFSTAKSIPPIRGHRWAVAGFAWPAPAGRVAPRMGNRVKPTRKAGYPPVSTSSHRIVNRGEQQPTWGRRRLQEQAQRRAHRLPTFLGVDAVPFDLKIEDLPSSAGVQHSSPEHQRPFVPTWSVRASNRAASNEPRSS